MSSPSGLSDSSEFSGNTVLIFFGIFVPIQIVCVALRFWSRYIVKASWGADDVFVAVSLFLQLVQAGLCIDGVKNAGLGYHILYLEETQPALVVAWLKLLVAIATVYFLSTSPPKIAILFLYRRLFPQKSMRVLIDILLAVLIGYMIAAPIVSLAACRPFEANWETTLPDAVCINKEAFYIYSSIPGMVTDIAMLILPFPSIWKLHTTRRIKVGLSFTFIVGSMGLIGSIIRFTTFFQNNSFTDATWNGVELAVWTEAEPGLYLICACLPTFKPLIERAAIKRIATNLAPSKSSKMYGSRRTGHSLNISNPKPLSSADADEVLVTNKGFQRLDDRSRIKTTTDVDIEMQPRVKHSHVAR